MRRKVICLLTVAILLLMVACSSYKDYSFQGVDLVHMKNVPDGYALLADVQAKYADSIQIGFFESQVYVLAMDNKAIKQTSISDQSFLIQYKNDIYISEGQIEALLLSA